MEELPALKAVGYWRTPDAQHLPRPWRLVRRRWNTDELQGISDYLRSGHPFLHYMGYSFCRFRCGISPGLMGSCDLTDGEWVWPQGLVHYVEEHAVSLPEPFVRTMKRHEWQVPDLTDLPHRGNGYDVAFWVEWSKQNQRRRWYALW